MKKEELIRRIKFYFKYIFDGKFRRDYNYETDAIKWASVHQCKNCSAQDWAGNILHQSMYGGLVCDSCLDEEMRYEFDDDDERF